MFQKHRAVLGSSDLQILHGGVIRAESVSGQRTNSPSPRAAWRSGHLAPALRWHADIKGYVCRLLESAQIPATVYLGKSDNSRVHDGTVFPPVWSSDVEERGVCAFVCVAGCSPSPLGGATGVLPTPLAF